MPPEPDAGPAVRFTIPQDIPETIPHTILIGAASVDPSSSFWIYLFGPGENDSTFGEELIPPFEFYPDSVDEEGRIVIDLRDTSLVSLVDYENLISLLRIITQFLTGDFWIHLRATEQTQLSFLANPVYRTQVCPAAGILSGGCLAVMGWVRVHLQVR